MRELMLYAAFAAGPVEAPADYAAFDPIKLEQRNFRLNPPVTYSYPAGGTQPTIALDAVGNNYASRGTVRFGERTIIDARSMGNYGITNCQSGFG